MKKKWILDYPIHIDYPGHLDYQDNLYYPGHLDYLNTILNTIWLKIISIIIYAIIISKYNENYKIVKKKLD